MCDVLSPSLTNYLKGLYYHRAVNTITEYHRRPNRCSHSEIMESHASRVNIAVCLRFCEDRRLVGEGNSKRRVSEGAPVTIIIEDYHRAFTNYFRHFPLSSRNYHRGLSSTYELFTLSPRYYHRGLSSTYELITLSPRYYHRALSSTYELFTLSSTVSPRIIIDAYEFLCGKLQHRREC